MLPRVVGLFLRGILSASNSVAALYAVFGFAGQKERIGVGGSSTLDVTFSVRKYNPTLLNDYFSGSVLQMNLRVSETFGNHREISGPLNVGGRLRNSIPRLVGRCGRIAPWGMNSKSKYSGNWTPESPGD